MPLEKPAYRDNMEEILKFTDGKQTLRLSHVAKFTGMDRHTVKKKFPFKNGYISAAVLARELS